MLYYYLTNDTAGQPEVTEFLHQVTITPALVQNEIHPYYQENDVIPFIQDICAVNGTGIEVL